MQLLFMILLNIVMGTIFYLVITLKLEKSATDYREKRLKREMDEILRVFNATAERNITILDNRITVLKKLMVESRNISGIDLTVVEEEMKQSQEIFNLEADSADVMDKLVKANEDRQLKIDKAVPSAENSFTFYVQEMWMLFKDQIKKFSDSIKYRLEKSANEREKTVKQQKKAEMRIQNKKAVKAAESVVVNDNSTASDLQFNELVSKPQEKVFRKKELKNKKLEKSEDELCLMLKAASDKHSLIADLYLQGYNLPVISRCSGIPEGEIKLILNLHNIN